jgi:hypothetical protein
MFIIITVQLGLLLDINYCTSRLVQGLHETTLHCRISAPRNDAEVVSSTTHVGRFVRYLYQFDQLKNQ